MKKSHFLSVFVTSAFILLFVSLSENSFATSVSHESNNDEKVKTTAADNFYKTPININAVAKDASLSTNNDLNRLNLLLQTGDESSFFKTLDTSLDKNYSIRQCMTNPGYNSLSPNSITSNQSAINTNNNTK